MSRTKNGIKANGKAIDAVERQRQALELRKAGATFQAIAKELGYAGHQGAYEAVRKAIADIPREAAEDVRQMELDRLDRMMLGLYDKAKKGDGGAIDRVLRIMDRRSRYLGLDIAAKEDAKAPLTVNLLLRDDARRYPPPEPEPDA